MICSVVFVIEDLDVFCSGAHQIMEPRRARLGSHFNIS